MESEIPILGSLFRLQRRDYIFHFWIYVTIRKSLPQESTSIMNIYDLNNQKFSNNWLNLGYADAVGFDCLI